MKLYILNFIITRKKYLFFFVYQFPCVDVFVLMMKAPKLSVCVCRENQLCNLVCLCSHTIYKKFGNTWQTVSCATVLDWMGLCYK